MKNFINTYNEILVNDSKQYIGLNIFKILNEWVESPDLLEFPKELQIELCKNLRRRFNSLYIISYKKIIEILKKYDYEYTDDVIEGMKKYEAINRGYLILISAVIDENENILNNKTLNFIKENFNDAYDNAYNIFSKIYNNKYADGLTIFHRDEYDPENTYTCVYINRNSSNMKDTLEHEISHFIRRVAKYGNKFPKTYSGLTKEKFKNKNIQCVDYITNIFSKLNFSKEAIYGIKEIAIRAFTDIEEQPTINSIVNSFIRQYENDKNKFKVNYLNKTISQAESILKDDQLIEFRLKWLKEFLEKINSYKLFIDNKEKIEKYFSTINYSKNYKIEFILKCISYLCFKFNYKEYDIDKIIEHNFKNFKFRDI